MISEAEWSRIQSALAVAEAAAKKHARRALVANDLRLHQQFKTDADAYEALLGKLESVPSWFEVWAAFDVVADVVEDWNLVEDRCLECDDEVDVQGVCVSGECRLRGGLLVHWGRVS